MNKIKLHFCTLHTKMKVAVFLLISENLYKKNITARPSNSEFESQILFRISFFYTLTYTLSSTNTFKKQVFPSERQTRHQEHHNITAKYIIGHN